MVVTLHLGRGTVSHTQEGMMRPQEKEGSHHKCPPILKLVEMNGDPQKEQGRTMDHREVLQGVEVGDHQGEALVHQGGDLGHQGEVSDRQEDLDHHMDHLEDLVQQIHHHHELVHHDHHRHLFHHCTGYLHGHLAMNTHYIQIPTHSCDAVVLANV